MTITSTWVTRLRRRERDWPITVRRTLRLDLLWVQRVTPEADGQPSDSADGDDLAGTPDDEDGITFLATVSAGQLDAEVAVVASADGLLDAWIDFNGDLSFDGANEQVFASRAVLAGSNLLSFSVPGSRSARDKCRPFPPQHNRGACPHRRCRRR